MMLLCLSASKIYNTLSISTRSRKKKIRQLFNLRSKRFQSNYNAKVRARAKKKKMEGGGGEEKKKGLPANPTILENAP